LLPYLLVPETAQVCRAFWVENLGCVPRALASYQCLVY